MLLHHKPIETEIPRQINASVLPPPISPLRMQREKRLFFVLSILCSDDLANAIKDETGAVREELNSLG